MVQLGGLELDQRIPRGLFVGCGVDRFECGSDLSAVGCRAGTVSRPGSGGPQVWSIESGHVALIVSVSPVSPSQHIPDVPVGQVCVNVRPERRTLGVLDPDPQHVLDPVQIHTDHDIGGPG